MDLKLICPLCVSVVLFHARWSSPPRTLGDPHHALDVEHHLLIVGFLKQRSSEVFLIFRWGHSDIWILLRVKFSKCSRKNISAPGIYSDGWRCQTTSQQLAEGRNENKCWQNVWGTVHHRLRDGEQPCQLNVTRGKLQCHQRQEQQQQRQQRQQQQ